MKRLLPVVVLFCLVAPAGAGSRLDLTLHLRRGRVTRLSSSAAFPPDELLTSFDPDWNLARVVSRGASDVRGCAETGFLR